jgi:FkbM family methyltransferase
VKREKERQMKFSSFVKRINNSVQEMTALGPATMARHAYRMLDKMRGDGERVREIRTTFGPLHIRSNNSDNMVMFKIFVDREYDLLKFPQGRGLTEKYHEILGRNALPLIIDAGANIGLAARFFASQFPKAAIACIEPDPAASAICRTNVASYQNIDVFEMAIGAAPGFVALSAEANASWATRARREAQGTPIVTIDEIMRRYGDAELFIVKIDIEGFEADLFSQNTDWIEKPEAILIEPHDWLMPGQGTSRKLQQTVLNGERELLISGENLALVRV